MDIQKYFAIGHSRHVIYNPLSDAKLDEIVELCDLPVDAEILDIACGNGEFLRRVCARWSATGQGIDLSPHFVKLARQRIRERGLGSDIAIHEGDGAIFEAESRAFDLVSCLGASWIWNGYKGSLTALSAWVKPGGLLLVGEPYFKKPPEPDYLAVMGMEPNAFGSHTSNIQAGRDQGLVYLHSVGASLDDWDRYEGYQSLAIERYAQAHPDDPDTPAMLKLLRRLQDAYLTWGRDTLGWAVYMFMKAG